MALIFGTLNIIVMLENHEENLVNTTNNTVVKKSEITDNKTTEAISAVENEIAEKSEIAEEKKELALLNYSSMELTDLVSNLKQFVTKQPVQQIKANVDAIKNAFNTKFGDLLAEKKEAFITEGGNAIDFQYSSPIKSEYNTLLGEYKTKRDTYYSALEKQLKDNLGKRLSIIESLKEIIEKGDSKTMYNEYKVLNDRWKTIGGVPRDRYNDTWKTYHHHVERFYDVLHLNKDFRELDFKHNLEEKLKLILRAEELSKKENVNEAFSELQNIHRIWKEEIGPVSKEHREVVWAKFSEYTKKLHDRRHDFYKELRGKHQEIIAVKLAIATELKNYDTSDNKTHKDWQNSIKKVEALRTKFFDAGKLPYNKSEEVWQEFKKATKKFNTAKNLFYKDEKQSQSNNLKEKTALVELAESLKDSENWEEATNTMKRIQADWRKVGHVPRKFSDEIWKRFKGACNHYFDRLHERKNAVSKEEHATVENKKELLDAFKAEENPSIENVKEVIKEWKEIGVLPRNSRHLDTKFNKVVDTHLEKLNLNREEIEMLKFSNLVDNLLAQKDFKKLENEQFFMRKKIDETVREMQQLENNLSFISNATEDNPFVINVRKGVQEHKEQLDIWQMKLNYLKKLEY